MGGAKSERLLGKRRGQRTPFPRDDTSELFGPSFLGEQPTEFSEWSSREPKTWAALSSRRAGASSQWPTPLSQTVLGSVARESSQYSLGERSSSQTVLGAPPEQMYMSAPSSRQQSLLGKNREGTADGWTEAEGGESPRTESNDGAHLMGSSNLSSLRQRGFAILASSNDLPRYLPQPGNSHGPAEPEEEDFPNTQTSDFLSPWPGPRQESMISRQPPLFENKARWLEATREERRGPRPTRYATKTAARLQERETYLEQLGPEAMARYLPQSDKDPPPKDVWFVDGSSAEVDPWYREDSVAVTTADGSSLRDVKANAFDGLGEQWPAASLVPDQVTNC